MCDNNNMILANTCACREIRRHLFKGLWNSLYIIMYIHYTFIRHNNMRISVIITGMIIPNMKNS